jgi:hypothetical protein
VDGIVTHVMPLYLMTERTRFKKRLLALADNLVDHVVPTIELPETAFGIVEYYDSDWNIEPVPRDDGFVGYLTKAAWVLASAYLVSPREEYRQAAKICIEEVWNNGGYDHVYGGLFQDVNWATGEITQGKNNWNVETGYIGGISNYYIADNPEDKDLNLKMADECIDFYMNNLIDHENGGTYSETLNDGTPVNTAKGHIWKGGEHAAEFGYFGYLYGSLYYKKERVTLYYHFTPKRVPQRIKLTPIAIEDNALVISKVKLNGMPYRHYDKRKRTLRIPRGVGGVFKVTFSPAGDRGYSSVGTAQ